MNQAWVRENTLHRKAGGEHMAIGIENIAVVWLGAALVLDGGFSIGMLFAFMAYKQQFTTRVTSFIGTATFDDLRPYFLAWLRISSNRTNLAWLTEWWIARRIPNSKKQTIGAQHVDYDYTDVL